MVSISQAGLRYSSQTTQPIAKKGIAPGFSFWRTWMSAQSNPIGATVVGHWWLQSLPLHYQRSQFVAIHDVTVHGMVHVSNGAVIV